MKKRLIALLSVLMVVLAIAIATGEGNRVFKIADFSTQPLGLLCDTTQAINDTIHSLAPITDVNLARIYQFIFQIDSTKSQSAATALKASDSTLYKLKVQSRFGSISNFFWMDVCSVTTGSTAADTGTWIIEKVLLLAVDTTTDAGRIGDQFRLVATFVDSMTSAISAGVVKNDRVYGSVQVAVRY